MAISPASEDTRVPRFVFITGGVVSSLGKGITAAGLGRLLAGRGLRVSLLKMDPYLNVDPGTMSPLEHGEVFVTDDGAETDLDLGNYERFTGFDAIGQANLTSGQVYEQVLRRERRGDYLGKTVQVVPHVTDEIQRRIRLLAEIEDADITICEVGGTVGDIESLPFLEALRQFQVTHGRRNVCFVHVTLVPFLGHAGELKTKPTQHSVQELRRIGITPDVLVCRSQRPLDDQVARKIAMFASIDAEHVVSAHDVQCLYEIPLVLQAQGVDAMVLDHFRLDAAPAPLDEWKQLIADTNAARAADPVRIALVGKYVGLDDAYMSVIEALGHAAVKHGRRLQVEWVDADHRRSRADVAAQLAGCHGVLVPGGFGARGVEGKVSAIQVARELKIPFLGICLGMQSAVIEFARNVCGMTLANSTEFDPTTPYPVVDLLPEQKEQADMGGTMRLGASPIRLHDDTRARALYGEAVGYERHRHRFEVNPLLRRRLEQAGLVVSGSTPDGRLVEIIELPASEHPFFMAWQSHPEFKSRPLNPAPSFDAFVQAACARKVAPAVPVG